MKSFIQVITVFLLSIFSVSAQNNSVLFVMSAADTLELNNGKKLRQTGVFLNEFYIAYKAVIEAGYEVEFATPNGIVATVDEESIKNSYWKNELELKEEALQFLKSNEVFKYPKTLEEAIATKEQYIGMVIPGGQGLMVDLFYDKNIPVLLKHFAAEKKPTGLICHAPSLLLSIPKDENPYIGFKVNAVTPIEEIYIETFVMKGRPAKRKIAKKLKRLGLEYKSKHPKADFAIKDRNLITSQNPFSGNSFTQLFLEALSEYSAQGSINKLAKTQK